MTIDDLRQALLYTTLTDRRLGMESLSAEERALHHRWLALLEAIERGELITITPNPEPTPATMTRTWPCSEASS